MAHRLTQPGSRTGFIVLLLVSSLVLTGVMTLQAHVAVKTHRTAAENVLRDYSMLVAGEFVRRTANNVGYYGYYAMIPSLAAAGRDRPLPAPAELATLDDRTAKATSLALYTLRFGSSEKKLETAPAQPESAVSAWLADWLAGTDPEATDPFRVTHAEIDGTLHTFVTGPVRDEYSKAVGLVGLEVDQDVVGSWLQDAFDGGPLLPPSLAQGEGVNRYVSIRVVDPAGRDSFRTGNPDYQNYAVARPYGDAYQGVFDGFVVHAAIDPDAAPDLAIGGLPRSNLPTLLTLLALTAGLLLAAILQLRRERDVSQMRSDFVSRVSHELRTPLTQIRMFGETLLLDRVRSEEERRRSLEIIDRESRRLSNLVENILQFSRSERGTIKLARRTRPIAPLIRELVDEFRPIAGKERVRIEIEALADVQVSIDDEAFRQMLFNLLDNAVKYGPEGQTILVGARVIDEQVQIWVEDEGPGVPRSERRRIWDRFERLDRDRKSAVAGTGIGLSVARELTVMHGGVAEVGDGRQGGARFTVTLPVVVAEAPAVAPGATFAGGAPE